MDVVSDAISAVRLGHPSFRRVGMRGSWCVRLDPYHGAGVGVVMKGSCWLLPDDGTPVHLGAGDAVMLPHGTGYLITDSPVDPVAAARKAVPLEQWLAETDRPVRPDDDTELLCGSYRLDNSSRHPLMEELPQVVRLVNRMGSHLELRAAIDLLAGELDQTRPGSSVALPGLLDLLFVYMIRSWMAEDTDGAWPRALSDPVTATALRALHAEPAAPWTNESLAAAARVSRPTLARRFTTLVGRPPMAYLTWWRLTLAATLLRDTSETVSAIADRVGYGTPYALSHAFERQFGTTPGRYRATTANRSPTTDGSAG
ncbi:AraC family transcriptional regulator [Streptomyces sp. enrichment culture]|uniref:AraC family transcriptional regulator n=1 Tax=Streptomyces sp. enrichment culture TaxID=1795815 RepID=UPI003F57BB8A